MMRYQIDYRALLSFHQPVFEQLAELRLLPRREAYQDVNSFHLDTEPASELFEYLDAYGNRVHYFSLVSPHDHLAIQFKAEVENRLENPFNFIPLPPGEERRELQRLLRENPRLNDFVLSTSETVPPLRTQEAGLTWPDFDPSQGLLESVQDAMAWLCENFAYLPGTTYVHCPFKELIEKRAGVCQDFAHLLMAILRNWGTPARYVMGYQFLSSQPASAPPPATHAWVEVFLPGRGWVGFDPSQQLLANSTYMPVAVGRDSHDAAPQRGCFKGGAVGQEPQVELKVIGQQ